MAVHIEIKLVVNPVNQLARSTCIVSREVNSITTLKWDIVNTGINAGAGADARLSGMVTRLENDSNSDDSDEDDVASHP